MEQLTLRETQLAEFDILCKTIDFLDEHHLRYMLAYGTLIGTIRHKGFIPWDDDIDVLMPREDYEKLKQLVHEGKFVSDKYIFRLPGDKGYQYPFIKAGSKEYLAVDETFADGLTQYLWVDFFPLDHYPEDKKKCDRFSCMLLFRMRTLQFNTKKFSRMHSFKAKLFWCYSKCIVKCLGGYQQYAKRIDQIAFKWGNKNQNTNKIAQGVWAEGHDFYNVETLLPPQKDENYPFEGKVFNIPADWDTALRMVYKDYMKLPPVEKRPTHGITVYRNPDYSEKK